MHHQRAFSLVELAIVLVILGLLVGGILAGQNLIRASELRAVTTEHDRFTTATHAFREKYFQLPGDMTTATEHWGAAHATPATCGTTSTGDARTCNGNGNGTIDLYDGSDATSNEYFRFWQHIANAGLIEGPYSGIQGSAGNVSHGVGGLNVPRSKTLNGIWYVRDMGNRSGHGELFDGNYGNSFLFGGQSTTSQPSVAILKPEDAWNLDHKIDDGMPATGRVLPMNRVGCTIYADGTAMTNGLGGAAASDAKYALTDTAAQCGLVFRKIGG